MGDKQELKIISLQISNVKKIKAVRVETNGQAMITVGGDNEAGKSSLLDSIVMALAGKKAIPVDPVRHGADLGRIDIDLGHYKITRTIQPNGKTELVVRSSGGVKAASPQALLDGFLGEISFDPLEFSRMKPKAQAEMLRDLTGLNFKELDGQRAVIYEKRTIANRELKMLHAQLAAIVLTEGADEEVSIADLVAQIGAEELKGRNLTEAHAAIAAHSETGQAMGIKVEDLKNRAIKLAETIRTEEAHLELLRAKHRTLMENVLVMPEPDDLEELRKKLAGAEDFNKQVRVNQEYRRLKEIHDTKDKHVAVYNKSLDDIDEGKRKALAAVQMPVPGLAFTDDGVSMDGNLWENLASSQQLRASVAIGLAQNPQLKVMLIRDGSLLDTKGKALIREMAEAAGAQIWMECVGKDADVSVLIEDGELVVK